MKSFRKELWFTVPSRRGFINITPQVEDCLKESGTGGFLATAYEHLARKMGDAPASTELDRLKTQTFFGREKENLVFPIALANLILHGIDQPNLWHGNTLTNTATYDGLYDYVPRARVERDSRTPAEIIESIAGHGRTVETALARLRTLMAEGNKEQETINA